MKTRFKLLLLILGIIVAVEFGLILKNLTAGHTIAILSPAGSIAQQQRDLMQFATILAIVVILPVFVLTFFIVWRFRDTNVKAKYRPNWDSNVKLEATWWAIPCIIIAILAVVTWQSSHALDPYKPIASSKKPLTVQVIALNWKWLFIYPEQNIATVNYLQIPEDTPVEFQITSDGPMNSFWIPQLGGQVYAMAGMSTKLHLIADQPGTFTGSSANLSGKGFSGMTFKAVASTNSEFNDWVKQAWQSPSRLTSSSFEELSKPSQNNPVAIYSGRDASIYDTVIDKYMGHEHAMGTQGETHVQ